jgi:TetR/AcrR family transcriptional regulator
MSAAPAIPFPASPRRTRLSSDDRRQQLLAHAIELFSQRGFSGTRTKDIAAACGVSEGILFRHFATKEDLYRAILESHAHEAGSREWMLEMKRRAAVRDDAGLIQSLVTHIMHSFRDDAAFHRLMLYAWLGAFAGRMMEQQIGMPTFDFLRKYVALRQREGAFRVGDPGTLVMALCSPALQFALNKYIFAAPWVQADDESAARDFSTFLLAGLTVKKKKT